MIIIFLTRGRYNYMIFINNYGIDLYVTQWRGPCPQTFGECFFLQLKVVTFF